MWLLDFEGSSWDQRWSDQTAVGWACIQVGQGEIRHSDYVVTATRHTKKNYFFVGQLSSAS
jgi:hypothetical protein